MFFLRAVGYLSGIVLGTIQVANFVVPIIVHTSSHHNVVSFPKANVLRLSIVPLALSLAGLALLGKLKAPPNILSALGVIGSWSASALFSPRRGIAVRGGYGRQDGLWGLLNCFVSYLGASQVKSRPVENAMLAAGALVAGYAIIQRLGLDWIKTWGSPGRPTSTMGNPDFWPHYLSMLAPIAFGRFLANPNPEGKLGWLAYLALLLGSILISKTRGTYLALGAAAVAFITRTDRQALVRNRWWLLGLAVSSAPFLSGLAKKASKIIRGGLGQRLRLWKLGIRVWLKRPIFGWGNDAIREPMQSMKTPDVVKGEDGSIDRSHNQLIDELSMRGIVGLSSFMTFWCSVILHSPQTPVGAGRAGAIAAFLGQSLVSFQVAPTQLAAWTVAGLKDEEGKQCRLL